MDRLSMACLIGVLAGAPSTSDDPPLVTILAVDHETGARVERFRVIPGVPYSGTADRAVAVWQPHLVAESVDGRFPWSSARSYETFRLRVEADGYRPSSTEWLRKKDDPKEITIRLVRDPGLQGVVLQPDGSPASGATLGIALPNRTLRLKGRSIAGSDEPPAKKISDRWRQPVTVKADAQGRFRLPPESDPSALLVVVHETGYIERPFAELPIKDDPPKLKLAPWGRIDGRILWGERPGIDEKIELIVSREMLYPDMVGTFGSVRSDARGRFEFRDIPPGRVQLSHLTEAKDAKGEVQYQFPVMHVDVKAGDATGVMLGAPGRAVVGRLVGLDSYKGVTLHLHPRAPHIGLPGDNDQWRGWSALRNSALGQVVFRDAIPVGEDGRFLIEGLIPESYQLFVNDGGKNLRGGTNLTVQPATEDKAKLQDLGEIRVIKGEK